ncbi:MAG: hypothetical protein Q9192_006040 [Flavoplaca navasiana]
MVNLREWLIPCTLFASRVQSWRLEPTNPFPPPTLRAGDAGLDAVFEGLEYRIQQAALSESSPWITDITSFSVAVTSASESLWTTSYTAPSLGNYSDGPPSLMSDQSYFRIASISKVFTVLAVLLQEQAGKCNLRDPITRHIPELKDRVGIDTIDWHSITLETLASQLSGIPREFLQELVYRLSMVVMYHHAAGIVLDTDHAPEKPSFQPNYKATYSNIAFVLLGFALEDMTGLAYANVVQSTIFNPLGMKRATLTKPSDSEGIIPNKTNDWSADIGTYGPTGGIYTTTSDLALFARSILTNKLLDQATTNAWFHPRSYSSSWSFAYGMPWEIFRTGDILTDSDRVQTIVTKAGGLHGYSSQLLLIPEYDLGLVIFAAGDGHALPWLREEVLKSLVPKVEEISRSQVSDRLTGLYSSSDANVNSSLALEVQGSSGLVVVSWISNGTDFLAQYAAMSNPKLRPGHVQLIHSNIKRGTNGQVWRAEFIQDELPFEGLVNMNLIVDVDSFTYASRSLEEFVFQLDEAGRAMRVNLPGFRISLDRQPRKGIAVAVGASLHRLMKPLGLVH